MTPVEIMTAIHTALTFGYVSGLGFVVVILVLTRKGG